ncbi:hypothetical protein PQX77_014815 [Marasmius sp. AFHP31]|nr:hypothetical protein PQX77_014815 [Marasmius sp. AFHP31]
MDLSIPHPKVILGGPAILQLDDDWVWRPAAKSTPEPITRENFNEHLGDSNIIHPDDHLVKLHRALTHFASLYGSTKASEFAHAGTELDGAELVDGTLWLRAAMLTTNRVEELDARGYWVRLGYFQ